MRSACRTVLVVAVCASLGGCSLLGKLLNGGPPLPARELYRLHLVDTSSNVPVVNGGATLLTGSVAIAPYSTPGLYGERGIVFRIGTSAYGAYPSREWALPLGEMLGTLTESVFERAPISRDAAVYDPPSRNSHTYTWRATVREFEEVNIEKAVSIAVRIDARLVRSLDDSLIWSGSARVDRPIPDGTMERIIAGLSDAAIEVINKLGAEAVAELRGSASAAARSQP